MAPSFCLKSLIIEEKSLIQDHDIIRFGPNSLIRMGRTTRGAAKKVETELDVLLRLWNKGRCACNKSVIDSTMLSQCERVQAAGNESALV